MTGRLNEATITGGIIAAFGLIAFVASWSIEADAQGNANARIFPLMGTGLLFLLGLMEFRRGLLGDALPLALSKDPKAIVALLTLAIAYVWLVGKFGYLLSTGVAAPVTMWLFGVRKPVGLIIAAIACPAIYHLIFFELMEVFPPFGEWFDLLDLIQGS